MVLYLQSKNRDDKNKLHLLFLNFLTKRKFDTVMVVDKYDRLNS